jgi:hypothetical protein
LALPVADEFTGGTSLSPFSFALNFSFCAKVKLEFIAATNISENNVALTKIRLKFF